MDADRASRTAVLVCQGRAVAHGRLAVGRFDDPTVRTDDVDLGRRRRAPLGGRGCSDGERGVEALGARKPARRQLPDPLARDDARPARGPSRGETARSDDPTAREPWRSFWTVRAGHELLAAHGLTVREDEDLLSITRRLGLEGRNRRSLAAGRVAVADVR